MATFRVGRGADRRVRRRGGMDARITGLEERAAHYDRVIEIDMERFAKLRPTARVTAVSAARPPRTQPADLGFEQSAAVLASRAATNVAASRAPRPNAIGAPLPIRARASPRHRAESASHVNTSQ